MKAFHAALKQAFIKTGANLVSDKYNALCAEIDPLATKIMRTPVHSIAGLRMKAMVSIHISPELWKESVHDLDWDKEGARALIEAVCAVTGLEVPAEQIEEDA